MREQQLLTEISKELKLGELLEEPTRLTGGYMHTMYKLSTCTGNYAIKLLNPLVMNRDEAFDSYSKADEIELKLQDNNIPIIPALEFNGKKMQCIDEQYYYIFRFVEGKSLKSDEITEDNCIAIAKILAKIHQIDRKSAKYTLERINIDWLKYVELSKIDCPEITDIITNNIQLFHKLQDANNKVVNDLPQVTCVCHCDLDSKNVLWTDNKIPLIIDLESSSHENPYKEFFDLALCWSGFEHLNIDFNLLENFVRTYLNDCKDYDINWCNLYDGNSGRLFWLEYNIKRALMIECSNEDERQLGVGQVGITISYIKYYDKIKDILLQKLNDITASLK